MGKYIRLMGTEEFIPVETCYAFIYDHGEGKTVLRAIFDSSIKTLEEIEALFAEDTVIEYYEDETKNDIVTGSSEEGSTTVQTVEKVLKLTFEHFCKDFICKYNSTDNTFFTEVTQKTDTELLVESTHEDLMVGYTSFIDLYESIGL